MTATLYVGDVFKDPRVQAAWGQVQAAVTAYQRAVAVALADPPHNRVAELEAEVEAWKLRYIEATNPGIDMNEVRRTRP